MTKSFLIDDICTDNAKTIAPSFYTFFTNIAYHNKVKTKDFVAPSFVGEKKTYNIFCFQNVIVNETRGHFIRVSRKKASDVDNPPPGYLKDMIYSRNLFVT